MNAITFVLDCFKTEAIVARTKFTCNIHFSRGTNKTTLYKFSRYFPRDRNVSNEVENMFRGTVLERSFLNIILSPLRPAIRHFIQKNINSKGTFSSTNTAFLRLEITKFNINTDCRRTGDIRPAARIAVAP